MKIRKMLKKGYLSMLQKGKDNEVKKANLFRGGSSGHYDSARNEFKGQCPRKSLLRFVGVESAIDYTSRQNFVTGLFHELNLVETLYNNPDVSKIEVFDILDFYRVKLKDPKIKLHTKSLEHEIEEGIKISMRPDLLITESDGSKFGIEAKSTVSEDKAYHSCQYPFIYAICQAALYKIVTDIPYFLVYGNYTNYGQFHSKWGTYCENMVKSFKNGQKKPFKDICPHFKKPYESLQDIEVRQFPAGNYYKLNCQQVCYEIIFNKDQIFIKDDYGNKTDTKLTVTGILGYYKKLKECIDTNTVPNRKNEIELYGEPKYSECQYCEFNEVCKRYDQRQLTYSQFIDNCKEVANERLEKVKKELIDG